MLFGLHLCANLLFHCSFFVRLVFTAVLDTFRFDTTLSPATGAVLDVLTARSRLFPDGCRGTTPLARYQPHWVDGSVHVELPHSTDFSTQ